MSSSFLVDKLQSLVSDWRNNNYANTLPETRNILEHITRIGFLHRPQLEALETYIYLKEVVGNRPTVEIIKGLFTDEKELLQGIGVSKEEAFDLLGNKEAIEALLTEKFGESLDYANQVYALTMGSGKTILMAAFMIYDFVLSYYHPKDRRFGKNALVFAPDKTIIESLKEIKSFDYSKIVPKEYLNVLLGLKYHYLEDTKSALAPIGNYNVIVTNSQKIILKTKKEATRSLLSDLQELEKREVENKRLAAIRNLESLLIFVDEAHHSYGKSLEGSLKKTRQTINYIHGNKPLVGVLNLTGTPYVNNRMIPDVVFHFGLKQGIEQGILKQVRFYEYSNVKSEEFIEDVVEKFWSEYGENKLEDKLPKIAFYAANIEEIQSDLRPKLEKILANRSISLGKVLEYHTEAEESRDEFNDLDKPESKKQFILLVGKGTEGWNCRSLTSTALYRKPRSSIFVLQSSTRCLRSIGDNSTKASVFVSNENYKILDKELKKNFQTSIEELSAQDQGAVEHQINVQKRKTLKVKKSLSEIVAVSDRKPENIVIEWEQFDSGKYLKLVAESSIELSNNQEAKLSLGSSKKIQSSKDLTYYEIISGLHHKTHLPCLVIDQIVRQSGKSRDDLVTEVSAQPELLVFIAENLVAQAFEYEEKEEIIEEEVELTKAYPFKLKVDQKRNQLVVYRKDEPEGRLGFHIDPYSFDSSDEKDLFRFLRNFLNDDEGVADIFFTGGVTDSTHNDFYFEYYNPSEKRVSRYFPDFLIETTKNRFLVVEVKGSDKQSGYDQNAKQYQGKRDEVFDEVFAKELGFKEFQRLNKDFEYRIVFDASLQAKQQELAKELEAIK